ncbi:MAG: hypothetical protein HY071_07060 [Chloroflexi bacterium]|nr:hypothetical protein [Chloroflexota bacterium]
MKSSQILVGFVAALALAGVGFAAGRITADAAPAPAAVVQTGTAGAGGAGGARVQGQGGGQGAFGGAVNGRVISVNADSITIEVRQGGANAASPTITSTIVLVGNNTRVVRTSETDIKIADIKANDQVTVVGASDSETGTVSAQAIVVGGNALQQVLGGGARGSAAPIGTGSPRPSPTR